MAKAERRESLIGSKIGNYSIVSTLGEGGMGIVFLAEHPMIGKQVAIKILHADHAARGDAAQRAFREARAVNEIRHPNVVDVIDCGVADLGEHGEVHYLLMEYLEGRPLRAVMREGALPVERATTIAIEVGRALAAAHAKNIIHRDIKPENIFLARVRDPDRELVKVLDFGIAKLLDGRAFGDRLTRSGVTLGTPQYMAPEQLDGEDIDGRVDVYALAIVLYEMLAGAAPFAEETTARGVWRRMNELPTLPADVAAQLPEPLVELLMRALDPDRVRRPEMADFVAGLAEPATRPDTSDPHTLRIPKAPTPKRRPGQPAPSSAKATGNTITEAELPRRRWITWLPIALALAAALVFVVAFARGSDRPEPTTEPTKPAVPEIVSIRVTSMPHGAEVFVGDEGAPRGTTPTTLALARGPGAVQIRIVHPGFTELRRSVSTLRDDEVATPLVALAPAPVGKTIEKPRQDKPTGKPTGKPIGTLIAKPIEKRAEPAAIEAPPVTHAPATLDAGPTTPTEPERPQRPTGDNLLQPKRR